MPVVGARVAGGRVAESRVLRRLLGDDALVAFVSDAHIGGDAGHDIFESPGDLAALFDALGKHPGPVDLVLAGDFFDFLRVAAAPAGATRASVTVARPEYAELFAALRRLAAAPGRTVVYVPGNHDAEAWWNAELQAELRREGLVHAFALAYAAAFASDPGQVVYCEHGNQFDPANRFRDYDDPLDTPLGDHVVTDVTRRLAAAHVVGGLNLREAERVFPLTRVPEWVAGRLFYATVTQLVRRVLLPLLVAFVAFQAWAYVRGGGGALDRVVVEIGYDVLTLVTALVLFLFTGPTRAMRYLALRFGATEAPGGGSGSPNDVLLGDESPGDGSAVAAIRRGLEAGERPPQLDAAGRDGARGDGRAGVRPEDIAVFVSGHTHAPSLTAFRRPGGGDGVIVNTGCFLRQLRPVPTRLGAPPVFAWRFEQTHVRVSRAAAGLAVELWEHPRPSPQALRLAERLAVAGRLPAEPPPDASPRVRARVTLG